MRHSDCDFSGWATRAGLRCADGRTIMRDAFKDNDGKQVPLVWNHQHNDPYNVLGHALLENRDEGVYAYCYLNATESANAARELIQHGDVRALSIYANGLKQQGGNVRHGTIREVSLVLAGANPGAFIESVVRHGAIEDDEEEGVIYTGEDISENLSHAAVPIDAVASGRAEAKEDDTMKEKTVQDVINTMTEEQKTAMYAIIGEVVQQYDGGDGDEEGGENVKHNIFDTDTAPQEDYISHSDMMAVIEDTKRYGSMKDSALAHGIEDIDYLFPEAKTLDNPPAWIQRRMEWVSKVMGAVRHTPFSRIKSIFADLTEDEARALGYIKGNFKKEQVFGLLKRITQPTTVYKKQKFDRDDLVDITDFDVVAWVKGEMRSMMEEELARAILFGDGRPNGSSDKINEDNIRPIMSDNDLFTIKALVTVPNNATDDQRAKAFVRTAIKARKNYRGSGEPSLFTTDDMLTDCLLMEDGIGHPLYESVQKLAAVLRVKEIVTVPVMEGVKGISGGDLLGLIVNLTDYNVGADKGGAVNLFDDFDIDYNQEKYLIETRCSGALIKPFSAIALELSTTGNGVLYYEVTPETGDNPSALGWYQKFGGTYAPTNDTIVRVNKTYYDDATGVTFTAVTPESGANPKTSGWYVLEGRIYRKTNDTSVVAGTTYYAKS